MIKKLRIKNVANIKSATYELGKVNLWEADNGIGKSNTLNALNYLLTRKVNTDNFKGENDFSTFIPKDDEHAVAEIEIELENGKTLGVKYYNKFTKKRGSSENVFEGRATECYINGTKQSKQALFDQELISEFGLENLTSITLKNGDFNPYALISDVFFAFAKLDYSILRQIITNFTGEPSFEEISNDHPEFIRLKGDNARYNGKLDIARKDYKKKADSLRREIEVLKATIDNLVIEFNEEEYKALEYKRMSLEQELFKLNTDVDSIVSKLQEQYNEKYSEFLESRSKDFSNNINSEVEKASFEAATAENNKNRIETEILNIKHEIEKKKIIGNSYKNQFGSLEAENDRLQEAYANESQDIPFKVCPHCGNVLATEEEIAEANEKRERELAFIQSKMENNSKNRENVISKTKKLLEEIKNLESDLTQKELILADLNNKWLEADKLYKEAKSKPFDPITSQTKALEEEKNFLWDKLNEAKTNSKASKEEMQIQLQQELAQVKTSLIPLQGALANVERKKQLTSDYEEKLEVLNDTEEKEILCDRYCKTRIETINSKTLETFGIEFVMLEDQVNGGLKDVCYPVVDGKPYSQMNRGLKELIGAKFITAIKRLTGVKEFPLIIDNAESLGSKTLEELKNLDSQLFLTRVVPGLNEIKFEKEM